MREYHFNRTLALLEMRITGHVSLNDIIEHYTMIADDESLPDDLRVLINCTEIQMDVKNKEIKKTMASLKKALKKHTYLKEAIVVSRPYATVIALLFGSMARKFKNYKFKVFSTEDAGREWLVS
jgi:hypothetical protein